MGRQVCKGTLREGVCMPACLVTCAVRRICGPNSQGSMLHGSVAEVTRLSCKTCAPARRHTGNRHAVMPKPRGMCRSDSTVVGKVECAGENPSTCASERMSTSLVCVHG